MISAYTGDELHQPPHLLRQRGLREREREREREEKRERENERDPDGG